MDPRSQNSSVCSSFHCSSFRSIFDAFLDIFRADSAPGNHKALLNTVVVGEVLLPFRDGVHSCLA